MLIALDTETHPFAPGLQAPPMVCLQAHVFDGQPEIFLREEGLDIFERFLDQERASFTFVHAAFDLAVMAQARPSLIPKIFQAYDDERIYDVAVRQKLIDIAMGEYRYWRTRKYSMETLAKRLLGLTIDKSGDTWRTRYNELDGVPLNLWPAAALNYAKKDVVTTLAIHEAQDRGVAEMRAEKVLTDQHRQSRAAFALYLASCWGLITDAEGCARLRAESEATLAQYEEKMAKAGFVEIRIISRGKNKGERRVTKKQKPVKQRMLDVLGWEKVKLTPKGYEAKKAGEDWKQISYISMDKEACADSGDSLLEDYSLYSQASTFLSGPLEAYEKGAIHPIHTRFEVLLDTGRTASSKPNVQNIARKEGARECFIPRDGNVFIGIDVDRAELHTLAQVCYWKFGKSRLGELLNEGFDPHTDLGATLARCTYQELAQRLIDQDEAAAGMRAWAKPANFGLPGGMGAKGFRAYAKFQYGLALAMEEAEYIVDSWKANYPIISGPYLNWIRELCESGKDGLATVEHFKSGRWRGRVPYCAAANGFFQGLSADAIKDAMYHLSKRCYVDHGTALFGCRIVNEIHDEFLIEAPMAQASDAAWEARDVLIERYNTWTPDFPVKSTPVLMDRWSKKAKHLVDGQGNLEVWRYAA